MAELLLRLLVAAVLTATLAGALSHLMTVSRVVMLGLSLLHAVLAGSLLGIYVVYVYGLLVPVPLLSIAFTVSLALLVAEMVERRFSTDAAAGVAAALSTTLIAVFGYLDSLVSPTAVSEAWSYVIGVSTLIRETDLTILLLVNLVVAPAIFAFKREFVYIAFDEDGARAMNLRVRLYRYMLYGVCGVVSSALAMSLGVFVAHVALVVPGVMAVKLRRTSLHAASLLISLLTVLSGYGLAYLVGLPPSGGVGLIATALLILSQAHAKLKA